MRQMGIAALKAARQAGARPKGPPLSATRTDEHASECPAKLTPRGGERIARQVENGQTPEAVAKVAGVCPRTVRKWVDRYRREGLAGLQDRSSRPYRLHRPTPQRVVEEIERLRHRTQRARLWR